MTDFFSEQFERLASENEELIQYIFAEKIENDHLISQLVSGFINIHHIWICRLTQISPDSQETDVMPHEYWIALNRDNSLQTLELLKFTDLNAEISWTGNDDLSPSAASVLQHIIKECVYSRGRIAQRLQELGLPYSSMKLVKTITW